MTETESANLADGKSVEAELMLVAIGRRSYLDQLNAQGAGVELDERGRIKKLTIKWKQISQAFMPLVTSLQVLN